jgi:hypothetical protein
MNPILAAILPVFLVIALGYTLRKARFLGPRGWAVMTKLSYYIFYPAFLIPAIWSADFEKLAAGPLALAVAVAALGFGVVMFALRPLVPLSGPTYSSVYQGVIRWNAFVFLPVVGNLYGPKGLALGAIVIAALVPVVNILCVVALSRYAQARNTLADATRSLATNPIVLACVAGLALNALHVPHDVVTDRLFKLMGDAALPLGLILAGSGLSFAQAFKNTPLIVLTSALKLLVMPVVMVTLARLFGADPLACNVALLCGAAPGAAASYVLAKQMGGDAPLMAGIVAATVVLSALTMPVMLMVLG